MSELHKVILSLISDHITGAMSSESSSLINKLSYAEVVSLRKTPNSVIRNIRCAGEDLSVIKSLKSGADFQGLSIKSVLTKTPKTLTVKFNNTDDALKQRLK